MVIRMALPTKRKGTANAQYRQRVPAHLSDQLRGQPFTAELPASASIDADIIRVSCTIGREIKFSLGTSDHHLIRIRHNAADRQVHAFLKATEAGPQDLTYKQLHAILGQAYRQLIGEHEANPPLPVKDRREEWSSFEVWSDVIENAERLVSYGRADRRREALDIMRRLFDLDAFLLSRSIILSDKSKADLIEALPDILRKAMGTLKARSRGDYRPDTVAEQFPAIEPPPNPQAKASDGKGCQTFADLFARWKAERQPSPSTISTWKGYVRQFTDLIGHDDPHRVTKADALRWKDALVEQGRKKINTSYLATLHALYAFAVSNAETTGLTVNPFASVKAKQKAIAGTGRLPFSSADAALILSASRKERLPHLRWIPWLQAQTGARVAEIAQLWGSMVIDVDSLPCIHITPAPDGGTLKNEGSERTVPIHPTLIADGFLDFVKTRGNGPLFYGRRGGKPAAGARDDGARKHPSKGVSNRLGEYVRKLGITDLRKAPSHSWRHYVKTELLRTGCTDRLADRIMGHAPRNEGDAYAHPSPAMMLEVISKLDLQKLAGAHETAAT